MWLKGEGEREKAQVEGLSWPGEVELLEQQLQESKRH